MIQIVPKKTIPWNAKTSLMSPVKRLHARKKQGSTNNWTAFIRSKLYTMRAFVLVLVIIKMMLRCGPVKTFCHVLSKQATRIIMNLQRRYQLSIQISHSMYF